MATLQIERLAPLLAWPLLALATAALSPLALRAQTDERILLATCVAESGSGDTHAAGVVTNSATGSPLAGARVEAVFPGGAVFAEAHTQLAGDYRLCNLRSSLGLALRVVYGTNESAPVVLTRSGARTMNLSVAVSDPVTIMGTVLDNATGQPLEGAWVTLAGTGFSTVTNQEGKFSFVDVPPGRHVLESTQLGYAFRADSLTFLRHSLGLRIGLSTEAIALDPVTVTGTRNRMAAREAEIARIGNPIASRFIGVTPSEMEEMRPRVVNVHDVIRRANITGIIIAPLARRSGIPGEPREWCVTTMRLGRDHTTGRRRCVAVVVDDVPMTDPEHHLLSIGSEEISHIQYLPPHDAAIRYGRMGKDGVLLIYTRR